MTDALTALGAAMAEYTARFASRSRKSFAPDETTLAAIRRYRAEVRADEGGGGMCHIVTEWLQAEYGFERLNVTYLDPVGEVIFTGHVVSILPDGSVFDPTADQIGEGHDIRLLKPDDPEFGRYRPEFYEDYHPDHPDIEPGELEGWRPFWSGTIDYVRQDQNREKLGDGWWLEDKSALLAYLHEQKALSAPDRSYDFHDSWLDGRIRELETGTVTPPATPAL